MATEWYRCPCCDYRHRVVRRQHRKRTHAKHMFCGICGAVRKFRRIY